MQKTVPRFFRRFTGWMSVLVLSCMDGCAPASNPCGSMVASAGDHWDIPNYASYGGQIVWAAANKEKHCTAAFQATTAESSFRSVSAFHCMRDLVLDYMVHHKELHPSHGEKGEEENFSIYLALNVAHVEGNACMKEGSAEKLAYVRIPVDFKDIPFLVDLEKKYQAIYAGLPPDQQASGEWVQVIRSREKKWIERFYDREKAGELKITSENVVQDLEGERTEEKFEYLACSTQHFDDPNGIKYKDYFEPYHKGQGLDLHVMCFLHSDVAIVDIELSSDLRFEPVEKACLHHAMLNLGLGTPLWNLHKDSEPWLQAQLDLREASLRSTMSKDDASLQRIDALSKSAPYNFYQEKKSPFVNDKDMVYGQALGLTIFAEFKRGDEKAFSFAELFLSKIPQENTHRKRYTLGQHVPVVVQKAWGMIALYSSSMEVLTGSSGSLVAYKNNILSVLHSIDGKEYFSGTDPYIGSTVIIDKKVDVPLSNVPNSLGPSPHSSLPKSPKSETSPPSSSSPSTGSPLENLKDIVVPDTEQPSHRSAPGSSDSERIAGTEATTPSRGQQPSQGSGGVATQQRTSTKAEPPLPGSYDPQQDTTTDPCMP